MNILFIASSFNPSVGGVERVTDILAREFARRGHGVFFLCASRSGDCRGAFAEPLFMDKEAAEPFDAGSLRLYRSILADNKIDVVWSQYPIAPKNDFFLINCGNAKSIAFHHGNPFRSFGRDMSSSLRHLRPRPFLSALRSLLRERRRFKAMFRLAGRVGFLSPSFVARLSRSCRVDLSKAFVMPNPLALPLINPDRIAHKAPEVLFVGRVSDPRKNLWDFVRAWELLAPSHLGWTARIVGSDGGCAAQKEYIASHSIPGIVFEGHQANVQPFYERASIVCMTSTSEGWSMVLVEGMSQGCPCCVFNTFGSAAELVLNGKTGFLVKPYDVPAMAQALGRLMSSPELLHTMARASISHIAQFTVSDIVDKWETLLQ